MRTLLTLIFCLISSVALADKCKFTNGNETLKLLGPEYAARYWGGDLTIYALETGGTEVDARGARKIAETDGYSEVNSIPFDANAPVVVVTFPGEDVKFGEILFKKTCVE